MDHMLLESYRRNGMNWYRMAREAVAAGRKRAAEGYASSAKQCFSVLAEHSPDKSERRRCSDMLARVDAMFAEEKTPREVDGSDSEDGPRVFVKERRPETRFKDVVGLDDVKRSFERKIIAPTRSPKLAARFVIRSGGMIVLYGPPGSGKTLCVRALAGECGADLFCLKGSDFRSKWVGESEKNIAALFEQASRCERAVIFIDEADTVLTDRGEASEHRATELNEFLQHIDGFRGRTNVLIVAACNRPWLLDPAVRSRASGMIYVPLPDEEARAEIIRRELPEKLLAPDVDVRELAARTERYSGRELVLACEDARGESFIVAERAERSGGNADNVRISRDVIVRALDRHCPSVSADEVARYERYAETGEGGRS